MSSGREYRPQKFVFEEMDVITRKTASNEFLGYKESKYQIQGTVRFMGSVLVILTLRRNLKSKNK